MNKQIDMGGLEGSIALELTTDIVSAYVSHNPVPASELTTLIKETFAVLNDLKSGGDNAPAEELKPAVSVKKSVTDDYIICLEDGKKFKSLKRHLRAKYGMSPEEYREKWGLSADYPMVSPNYAKERSRLAREMKLGQTK